MNALRSLSACAGLVALLISAPLPAIAPRPAAPSSLDSAAVESPTTLPGREVDARVAAIAYRLATAGHARCPTTQPAIGFVLQHLSQFQAGDRDGMIAALALDRGPAVIALVPGGPAARAGVRLKDVLLSVADAPLPREDLSLPFDASRAHERDDRIVDLLAHAATAPFALGVLRDGQPRTVRIAPVSACPGQVTLARSPQHNAYADGRHVFMTTGLVALARSDDELAFIVAHEMAHIILGHAAVMRSDAVKHGLGRTLGHSGEIVRQTERAADRLGGELMIDAGYDPVAATAIFARVDGMDLGLFTTHDSASERIAQMRALVAERHAP